jgi:hypothetical protein
MTREWNDVVRSARALPPARAAALSVLAIALVPALCLAASSTLYPPSKKEAGALRLAQVMALAKRSDIVGLGKDYQRLLAAGLPDSVLVDHSIAAGRVFCCNGLVEKTNQIWFYVPPGVDAQLGDIVEMRLGREPGKHEAGTVNVVTRVRDRASAAEHPCRWEPPNDRLWMRVLNCDGLAEAGWTHKNGIGQPWLMMPPDSAR